MGKLDPLLWLPADDLLIDGVNDILQFLSGEEVLLKRPEERLPWDGDLWLRPVPFDIWFQHVEMNTRAQSELKSLSDVSTCAHLFVVFIDENKIGSVLSRSGGPWGSGGEAARMGESVRVSGHGGQTARILIFASLIFYPPLNAP